MAIHKIEAHAATCDNCGDDFRSDLDGFTIFLDSEDVREQMSQDQWYMGVTDPDHQDKHYCPSCYKQHPEVDDKIIVDETRKKIE